MIKGINLLTAKQLRKVNNVTCNNWVDIRVSLRDFNEETGKELPASEKKIVINFTMGGTERMTTIPAQVSGRY